MKNTKKYKNVERSKVIIRFIMMVRHYNDLYAFKDSNTKVSRVYKINQTSDKYEEDSNIDAEKFEKR